MEWIKEKERKLDSTGKKNLEVRRLTKIAKEKGRRTNVRSRIDWRWEKEEEEEGEARSYLHRGENRTADFTRLPSHCSPHDDSFWKNSEKRTAMGEEMARRKSEWVSEQVPKNPLLAPFALGRFPNEAKKTTPNTFVLWKT